MRSIITRYACAKVRIASLSKLFPRLVLLCSFGLTCAANAAVTHPVTTSTSPAERSLMQGRIDEAIATLQSAIAANPRDGQAYLLLCRSYYAEEHQDQAVAACENAVRSLPGSSEAYDWLGRALGMKASHAGPFAGFGLARKVRTAFETAVQLDPRSAAAADDLSEFYINAPGIAGGGQDKATDLADRVQNHLPQVAHRIRAMLAEKNKDYGTAEHEFKAAVGDAKHPEALLDLGAYYMRRDQQMNAVETLKQCLTVDRSNDASIVDVASILNSRHLEPQLAEHALQEYLRSSAKSDAAPVIHVEVMLGKMMVARGDTGGAKIEFEKALELASGYAPAKQALRQL